MDKKYYAVILTLHKDKLDVRNKDYKELKKKITDWGNKLKTKDITIDGPWFDEGKNKNLHLNLTLETEILPEEILKKLSGWRRTKGFVRIEEVRDLKKWISYSKRNHYTQYTPTPLTYKEGEIVDFLDELRSGQEALTYGSR